MRQLRIPRWLKRPSDSRAGESPQSVQPPATTTITTPKLAVVSPTTDNFAQQWLGVVQMPAAERRAREAAAVEAEIARVYGQLMAERALSSHPEIEPKPEDTKP